MSSSGQFEFRQDRPFFDMVGSCLIALAGSPSIINEDNPMRLDSNQFIAIPGKLTTNKRIRPHEIHEMAVRGNLSHGRFVQSCCSMLANTAYESVKHHADKSEIFEFFRHVRNAASHNNAFHFYDSEPIRPAQWKGLIIDHTKKGKLNPLEGKQCFGGCIAIADLFELLWEIEKKIP